MLPDKIVIRNSLYPSIKLVILIGTCFAVLLLSGCQLLFTGGNYDGNPDVITKAQIVFTVNPLKPLADGETLELVIVDEVTGLPFHQERIVMNQMADGFFGTVYEARIGSLLTYLFFKVRPDGTRVPEVAADGQPIRYRMYQVSVPGISSETIAGWEDDSPDVREAGYIQGRVVHSDSGDPLGDILVSAGGVQTVSDADGNFIIFPLPPGVQNLTAASMTGLYLPAQATAEIASGKVTPAELSMIPTTFREVTFNVQVPADTVEGAPIRIAGNLTQLGNTFSDIGGGMSGDTRQMPVLAQQNDASYSTTMILPAGVDIRYKYTLGDGFFNAEHAKDLGFLTHQLIIPVESDKVVIEDEVATWRYDSTETVWFQVIVPPYTPQDEPIGIQFRIDEWMPALPMFKIKEDTWVYPLISPHNFSSEIPYRYCRNAPCIDHFQAGVENIPEVRSTATNFSQAALISDQISSWQYLGPAVEPGFSFSNLSQLSPDFTSGIGLTPTYNPNQESYLTQVLAATQDQINHVMISPAWVTAPALAPQMFEVSINRTPRWQELAVEVMNAQNQGLEVSLFPTILFDGSPESWWNDLATDQEQTWQSWLADYQRFIFQYADFSAVNEVEILVLGGDWLEPSLPVNDHSEQFNQPGNMASLWEEIIGDVRDRYQGQVGWMLTLESAADPPDFLDEVDVLYLLWDQQLDPTLGQDERIEQMGEALDEVAQPLVEDLGKPFILVISVPSIQGYGEACIPSPTDLGDCLDTYLLSLSPSASNPGTSDLALQAAYYHAILSAVSARDWVDGVISQGYYPPLALHDTSSSIHGKPAMDLFREWLALVLGN